MYYPYKVTEPMKRYFKNLWMALTGSDPFRDELEEKNSQLENAAENVQSLQDQLYAALNKWNESAKMAHDYEVLIENFRERINEKDTLMERMKKDYQQRIEQYTHKIEELQGHNVE